MIPKISLTSPIPSKSRVYGIIFIIGSLWKNRVIWKKIIITIKKVGSLSIKTGVLSLQKGSGVPSQPNLFFWNLDPLKFCMYPLWSSFCMYNCTYIAYDNFPRKSFHTHSYISKYVWIQGGYFFLLGHVSSINCTTVPYRLSFITSKNHKHRLTDQLTVQQPNHQTDKQGHREI